MSPVKDFKWDPIGPDELEMIQRVFQSELRIRALSSKCEEAEALAAKLISAYQSGTRDAASLAAVAKRL
ncbi:hypothetical protein [Ensifer aridi]|uniref:hypothetical protein n=1 Tax=Ensifer aridi TaxID=1708715 RepID=UPI00042A3BD9|nr:hypothetical protein [Ensifer aridi]MCA1368522.1 hypothetical protein [Bradyrhizobium sp. BRP14]